MTDFPKIDPQAKEAWLQALTSGKYEQATGMLYDGHSGYCCLGVLAKVQGCEFDTRFIETGPEAGVSKAVGELRVLDDGGADVNANGLLEGEYANRFGLTRAHQDLLSNLNDGGELILRKEAPLYDLAAKLAKAVTDMLDHPDRTAFLVDKRSFAEIAEVIRENF